jgi:hypothetical protein
MISYNLRRNIIDISIHLLSALAFGAMIYWASGRVNYALIFVAGAVFIDLDHLIDHYLHFKNKFTFKDFFSASFTASGKAYVFLHSWELIFLLFVISGVISSLQLFIFTCGLTVHLIIDLVQRRNKLFYFIIYRVIKKFNADILLPEILHKE